jgi:hypothetical protein
MAEKAGGPRQGAAKSAETLALPPLPAVRNPPFARFHPPFSAVMALAAPDTPSKPPCRPCIRLPATRRQSSQSRPEARRRACRRADGSTGLRTA